MQICWKMNVSLTASGKNNTKVTNNIFLYYNICNYTTMIFKVTITSVTNHYNEVKADGHVWYLSWYKDNYTLDWQVLFEPDRIPVLTFISVSDVSSWNKGLNIPLADELLCTECTCLVQSSSKTYQVACTLSMLDAIYSWNPKY